MPTKEIELSGVFQIDADWAPQVPDSRALLKDLGIIDVKLLDAYRIKTAEDYALVGKIVLRASQNIATINARWEEEVGRRNRLHKMSTAGRAADLLLPTKIQDAGDKAIKLWNAELDRQKAVEQARLDREQAERDRVTREDAARIKREAEAAAAKLRKAGEMSAATNLVAKAEVQAAQVVEEAEMSNVGVIVASRPSLPGITTPRKWKGREVVKEGHPDWGILQAMKAIVEGKFPLRHLTPVRGQDDQMKRLIDFDPIVLSEIGNRLRKADLGCAGIEGFDDIGVRHSTKGLVDDGWA